MDPAELVRTIEPGTLDDWVTGRRWFASKARDLLRVEIVDAVTLAEEPALVIAIAEAVFAAGTHEHYQLPLALVPADGGGERLTLATAGDLAVVDALGEPQGRAELGRLQLSGQTCGAEGGPQVAFRLAGPAQAPPAGPARLLEAEQSNSAIAFDESVFLKLYRRLEPGENPELEMLRFLARRKFEHVPELIGWCAYRSATMDATLAVAQRFIAGGRDGWGLALERLRTDPQALLGELRDLGRVVGLLHAALGADHEDPDFAPETKGAEHLDLTIATIDEEIREVFQLLSEDDERVAPLLGREAALRERLAAIQHLGDMGMAIRSHGDLHLGQALLDEQGRWIVIDFEGEPARSLRERRRRRSPLRDLAGLLRSVDYVTAAARFDGVTVPRTWEREARSALVGAYLEHVDRSLLPNGEDAVYTLLDLFTIEKTVYELRYELHNRPDWVGIPVAGILGLLEPEAG